MCNRGSHSDEPHTGPRSGDGCGPPFRKPARPTFWRTSLRLVAATRVVFKRAAQFEGAEYFSGHLLGRRLAASIQMNFGLGGRFVRIADPGELWDLARPRFLVQTFGITSFANFQWRIDKDFEKIATAPRAFDQRSSKIAVTAIGADKGGQGDQAGRREELRERADPPNVFLTVFRPKAEPKSLGERFPVLFRQPLRRSTQPMTNIVPVQEDRCRAALEQELVEGIGDGAFATTAQAGKPNDAAMLSQLPFPILATDRVLVPNNLAPRVMWGSLGCVRPRCRC